MSWSDATIKSLNLLNTVEQNLRDYFVERDDVSRLLAVAAVCREHLLLIGPPGTAKTELITRFTKLVKAKGFYYLVTRFTEPSEVFGPLDLKAFQEGRYTIRTENMLPDAEIAFLDEVFQGNSAILNGFLSIANERIFHNGAVPQKVPLITLVGASNDLPDDPALRAFADRFLLRATIPAVSDDALTTLLDRGWEHEKARIRTGAGRGGQELPLLNVGHLNDLHHALESVNLTAIRDEYAAVVKEVRNGGAELSDRRVVRGQKLVAAAALLRRADKAELQDFWPLLHIWTRLDDQPTLDQVVAPRLKAAGVAVGVRTRPAEEIADELEGMERREADATTDIQHTAILSRYNRIRLEIDRTHPRNTALTTRVRESIQRVMERLSHQETH